MADQTHETAAQKPLLSLKNINMTFGGVRALKNVSFDVLPGEVHCLAGENGCGKSTLIKVITGVYKPAEGAVIEYDGQTYSHMSPVTAQAGGIQVIWQDLALFPEMTVAENIAFQTVIGRWPRLVNYAEMRRIAVESLEEARRDDGCRPRPASFPDRPTPDRGHRPGAGRRSEAGLHGRADGVADAVGNRLSARYRAQPVGVRRRGGLRQPPAGGSAGNFQPRHRAARRQSGRRLPDQGADAVAHHRTDDRQDVRSIRPHARCRRQPGRARGEGPDASRRIRGCFLHGAARRDAWASPACSARAAPNSR